MVSVYAQFGKRTYFFSGITSKVSLLELTNRGYKLSESYDADGEFVVIMVKR